MNNEEHRESQVQKVATLVREALARGDNVRVRTSPALEGPITIRGCLFLNQEVPDFGKLMRGPWPLRLLRRLF